MVSAQVRGHSNLSYKTLLLFQRKYGNNKNYGSDYETELTYFILNAPYYGSWNLSIHCTDRNSVINYAAHTPVIYVYIALYVKKYGLYSPIFNLHSHNTKYKWRYICVLGQHWLGRRGARALRTPRALHFLASQLNKCSTVNSNLPESLEDT